MVSWQVKVHEVPRLGEERRPAAEVVHRDRHRDEASAEEQDNLCEIGSHHGAQSAQIGVQGRERPEGHDQNGKPHRLAVTDPRHHLGEDAIERVGCPEQRRAEVEQRVQRNHQHRVRQRDLRPETLLEELADRDDSQPKVERDEEEGRDDDAKDGVELEVRQRQAVDVGCAGHREKMAGLDIGGDRGNRNSWPPQRARTEKILLGVGCRVGPGPEADREDDDKVREDDPEVDHGSILVSCVRGSLPNSRARHAA